MKQRSMTGTLSLTDIFDDLAPTQLELIASICEPQSYRKGEILIHENEGGDEMYVIARGVVEVLINPELVSADEGLEQVVLMELRQGQVFGEISLVDQGLRSATVRASDDNTEVLRLPRERLMLLCDTYPELGYKIMRNLAADLAFKIRNADLTIRQYQLMLSGEE